MDYKIVSKALASSVIKVLPDFISLQQMTYVKNEFSESHRSIVDMIEIADTLIKEGFLVTMDMEKTFDSLYHTFVISVLKKTGFGNNFVSWIETLISKQESCIISDGNTTKYFYLERWARQGDPIHPISLSLFRSITFWLETIRTSKILIFLIIYFYTQLVQMIQHFFLKTRNQ